MHERRRCLTYLLLGFIWLYVLVMSRARFRVNLYSLVAWISRNLLLERGAVSTWMFVYELNGCRLVSCCSLQGFVFEDIFGPRKNDLFCPVFVFHRGKYFKNEDLNISWISRYNSILGLKNGFHNRKFYSVSVSDWT